MIKYIQTPGVWEDGTATCQLIPQTSGLKIKTAAPLHEDVAAFISKLKPDSGKIYVLVNALGAGEFYGSNLNSDWFGEEELLGDSGGTYGLKTFLDAGVYRHHCFVAGTPVVTGSGRRVAIATVKPADIVRSGDGHAVPVVQVFSDHYTGAGVELELSGVLDNTRVTASHPFLCYRYADIHCRHKYMRTTATGHGGHCREFRTAIGPPRVVAAGDLRPGDYVLRPMLPPGSEAVDPNFAELVGWVASEGCVNDGSIQFTFSTKNEVDISSVARCLLLNGVLVGVTELPEKGTTHLIAYAPQLAHKLSKYVRGTLSVKRLTEALYSWDAASLLRMLGAFIDGDGHIAPRGKNRGQLRIRSASRQMLQVLSDIIMSLGIPSTSNWDTPPGTMLSPVAGYGEYTHLGSGCVAVSAEYAAKIAVYSRKKLAFVSRKAASNLRTSFGFLTRVHGTTAIELDEQVYTLEVGEPNTYVANEVAVHNCNKDKEKSFGEVLLSVYNRRMHRIELILAINKKLAVEFGHSDLVAALETGKPVPVSMGCKVPFDVCRICGFESKSPKSRCDCMRLSANSILSDGRRVCVANPRPRFFDISFVIIGADSTSFAMTKIASLLSAQVGTASKSNGQIRAELLAAVKEKSAAQHKFSELIKRVPAVAVPVANKMSALDGTLDYESLLRIAMAAPMSSVLSGLTSAGVVLSPLEYQTIALANAGMGGMAQSMHSRGASFAPSSRVSDVSMHDFSPTALPGIDAIMRKRSCMPDMLGPRLFSGGCGGEINQIGRTEENSILSSLSAPYNGYRIRALLSGCDMCSSFANRESAFFGKPGFGEEYKPVITAFIFVSGRRGYGSATPLDSFLQGNASLATTVMQGLRSLD